MVAVRIGGHFQLVSTDCLKYPRTVCASLVGSAASLAPTGQCASRLVIIKSKHTPILGRIQAGNV